MEHSSSITKTLDSVNYETCYGHCRCCLEEGQHRDITRVYHQSEEKEVYVDIFLDCFNVFLSINTNLSTLICSSCVSRLRDARNFKDLVLRTEEQLMAALQDSYGDRMVLINVPIPKETLDTTIGFKIKVHNNCEEPKQPPAHNTHTEQVNNSESVIEQTEEELPLREDTNKEKWKMNMEEDELEPKESGPVAGSDSDSETGNPESPSNLRMRRESDPKKREKMALITNTYTVLANCNATLFKSKKQDGFPCFYCKEIFTNFDLLRQHQTQDHKKNYLLKSLKTYSFEGLVVYADVTELKCDLCDRLMPNLKEFKSHLIEYHEKKFFPKITDRILPFKLFENHFECQICPVNYETFGAIERHMNTHFRNYICKVCGGGFVTIMRLKTHYHSLHKEGTYPCEYCDKVFKTQLRHKVHVDFVHKMLKKLKCYQCSERFSDYFVRKKHMVEVHGELPIVYRCNVCSKEFNRRYTLSCHMKRHLQLKDVECDLCTYTCYNKTELREHMLKHNKRNMDRTFLCTTCDKTYSRKKTLREHMRIHMDDRRYTCLVCDQTFVQRTGLVSHIKNHHKDYASEYESK